MSSKKPTLSPESRFAILKQSRRSYYISKSLFLQNRDICQTTLRDFHSFPRDQLVQVLHEFARNPQGKAKILCPKRQFSPLAPERQGQSLSDRLEQSLQRTDSV